VAKYFISKFYIYLMQLHLVRSCFCHAQ